MDFLHFDNRCGQQLLKLVARGSSILAEMNRLSENIPQAFFGDKRSEYSGLLFDFSYLSNEDALENQIQNSSALLEKDEEFRETHMDILQRFYGLFESIWKYITDLLRFLEDIREGFYIQQTFESILVDQDGKQLMAEALYLYGVILLQLDIKIEGKLRERMLIAYLRYRGSGNVQNLDEVCRLLRGTGYVHDTVRPAGYPEEYFARITLPKDIVDMIIGRIRSDDIYQMAYNFPAPEQRSTALSTQGGMLYVLLYFQPQLLHGSKPVMREIVDKHFPDNWIICYHMGQLVDLTKVWMPYKAASQAISNTLQMDNIQYYQKLYSTKLRKLMKQLSEYLREGVLNEGFVLDEIHSSLLPCVRDCNCCLRWFMLHETTTDKKLKPAVTGNVTKEEILMLLLNTSQLEYLLQEMFASLIKTKAEKWDLCKEQGVNKMEQLAQYFGGEGVLSADNVEENLAAWFRERAETIEELDYESSTHAGRKIQNLLTALQDVEQYHQVDSNLMVQQNLIDTRQKLRTMIRYVNIEERVNITVQTVGDFSYGWHAITNYIGLIQAKIKKNPSLVMQLRSTFLKLASMMEIPLTRIHLADSPDLESVSEYFSTNLVEFVRRVLAVIPSSMFEELITIIKLLTTNLKDVPTKLPKTDIKSYAQLEERYALARTTYQISKFTEGILAMERTLMGVIQIDPQKLLEEGVRKELVDRLQVILHFELQFPKNEKRDKKSPQLSFEDKLDKLSARLKGMKESFEYVQDYMNVFGLQLWQEEFSRLINFNVEMECNAYLTKKVLPWQSRYQSYAIPIKRAPPVEGDNKANFTGRLVAELLAQTDSRKTFYVDQLSAWYDEKGSAVVALQTFGKIHNSIGTPGMTGCDKLLSFMIVKDIQTFIKRIRIIPKELVPLIEMMNRNFNPPSSLPTEAKQLYADFTEKGKKIWPVVTELIMRVGRCQLLRRHIGKELVFACKLESQALHSALSSLNTALVNDVRAHYKDPETHRYPNGRKPILPELSAYLENCGMVDPITKIYITTEPVMQLIPILVNFVIAHLPRFTYVPTTDSLVVNKKDDPLDGSPFVVGLVTVLKQFNSSEKDLFVAFLCQYCRVAIQQDTTPAKNSKEKEKEIIPVEVCNCLVLLENFCKYASVDRKQLENLLPPYLIAKHREFRQR